MIVHINPYDYLAKENKKETLTPTTTTKSHITGQILTKSRKSHTPAVSTESNTNLTSQQRSPDSALAKNQQQGKQLVSILEPPRKTRVSILPTTNERSANKKKEETGGRRSTRALSGNEHDLRPSHGNVDERIPIHQGAIDRTALTSQPPADIVKDVKRILRILGIEAKSEGSSPYLLKCSRKKAKTFKGRRRGADHDDDDDEDDMNIIDDDQFIINDSNITTTSDISLVAPSNPDSVVSSSSSAGGVLTTVARGLEPIYGDSSIDNGDEIRFAVEVCRFQNLPGLYIIDIRRLKGNVWAYKFLYHKLIDFLNVGRDSAFVL